MPALATFKPSSVENLTRCEVFSKRPLTRVGSRGNFEEPCSDRTCKSFPFNLLPGECADYYSLLEEGRLILLTNYRLFVTLQPRAGVYNIPLLCIDAVECRDMFYLNITTKDGRAAKVSFENNESCLAWFKLITTATTPSSKLEDVFAFPFYAWCSDENVADRHNLQISASFLLEERTEMQNLVKADFDRLQYCPSLWRITDINKKFEFCSSYPICWIVPACVSDADVDSCGQYRSLRRVPAVVWRNRANGAVLVRSSQPEPGFFGWRSMADENMLYSIISAASQPDKESARKHSVDKKPLLILDARSYTVAWANRAKGGGFESCENYKRCEIDFLGLANIHSIRYSFQKFRMAVVESTDSTWFQNLENSQWLHHIRALLNASLRVVEALQNDGRSVLVHCSDGWDRTTQIVSLAKLLLDPHFRTLNGFKELVETEWVAFGHKFAERLGMQNGDLNQRAPVFLQWLDCIHYITREYPCSFEFNELFLVKLAQHAYSGLFGTFLCNSIAERSRLNVSRRTFSVWDFLNWENAQFRNVLFVSENSVLFSCLRLQDISFLWRSVYCPLEDPGEWKADSMSNSLCEAVESCTLARAHSCDSLASTPALAGSSSAGEATSVAHRTGSDSNLVTLANKKTTEPSSSAKLNPVGVTNEGDADVYNLVQSLLSEVESESLKSSPASSSSAKTSVECSTVATLEKCFRCDALQATNGINCVEAFEEPSARSTPSRESARRRLCQQGRGKVAFTELIDVDGLVKVKDCAQQRIQEIITSYERKIATLQAKLSRVQRTILTHQCVSACMEKVSPTNKYEEMKMICDSVVEPHSCDSMASRSDVSWEAVEDADGAPTRWIPDHAARRCMGCDTKFWIVNRKHHCRSCGKIFCSNCSSYECPVPDEQFYEPVRVCNGCFSTLCFQHKVKA